jgi:glycosyltransferase involved in cell wall biosynthesis
MNVLFASCIRHWGGGEKWMLSAALGLRERGHAAHFAGRAGSELLARARAAGLPAHGVVFHGDFDPAGSWFFYRLCRRLRPDLLCTNMDKVLRVAGPAARLAGVPAVVPRRGSEMPIGRKLSHRWAWRSIATGVIANSEATRRTMLESAPWLPPERVRVIYNGLRLEEYDLPGWRASVREELGTPADAPVVGMIGELTARKNHALLLRELPELRRRFPGLEVWIVGEGPERERLLALARAAGGAPAGGGGGCEPGGSESAGAGPAVKLLGFRGDVPYLIAGIDLLAHPARVEGFGYALVEAMAGGKPVVAAAASSIPEIVADGKTGLLFPPEDGAALREATARVLTDPGLARTLGEAGRTRARALFSLERMLDEVEAYFAEHIATRRPPPREFAGSDAAGSEAAGRGGGVE